VILVVLLGVYRYVPGWQVLLLPIFVLIAFAAAAGAGLWLAALNVRYRDFRYVIPFLVQIGLYVSPVGFTSALVPANWRLVFSLNPMVGVIDGFRWTVLGAEYEPYWPGFALSVAVVLALLAAGVYYFRSMEKSFADVI
jgi:lipopolysaccharide transport system permease protein